MNGCLGETTLQHFALFIQDMNWLKINNFSINCLKASTDKAKQPNWNKTNEINIILVSTTIFQGQKKNTGSVSVNIVTSQNCTTMCYHINTVDTKRSPNGTHAGLPDGLDQMFMAYPQKFCFKKSMFSNLWWFGVNHWCTCIYSFLQNYTCYMRVM